MSDTDVDSKEMSAEEKAMMDAWGAETDAGGDDPMAAAMGGETSTRILNQD